MGYGWLEESWDQLFEEMEESEVYAELEDIFGSTLVCAMLLSAPESTRANMADDGMTAPTCEEALELLPAGLFMLGVTGKAASRAGFGEAQPETPNVNPARHVGRNDPCPCGLGKKYKHCCLN